MNCPQRNSLIILSLAGLTALLAVASASASDSGDRKISATVGGCLAAPLTDADLLKVGLGGFVGLGYRFHQDLSAEASAEYHYFGPDGLSPSMEGGERECYVGILSLRYDRPLSKRPRSGRMNTDPPTWKERTTFFFTAGAGFSRLTYAALTSEGEPLAGHITPPDEDGLGIAVGAGVERAIGAGLKIVIAARWVYLEAPDFHFVPVTVGLRF